METLIEPIDSEALDFRKGLGDRIAQTVDNMETKAEAAAAAGVTAEQLNKWIRGTVKVPAEALYALSGAARVDFSWLVTGEGDMFSSPAASRLRRTVQRMSEEGDQRGFGSPPLAGTDFIRLRFYSEIHASAGPGATPASEHADSVIAFTRRFLVEHGAMPDRCSVIRARGDSMVPTIPDASLLVVDHSQTEISNGCIMVIGVGEDLLVKRVRRRLDGLIELVSDNPAYPPETIGRDMIQQLRVIGRVVYFCRAP